MSEFSLSLNDDQLQLKDWVHQFHVWGSSQTAQKTVACTLRRIA